MDMIQIGKFIAKLRKEQGLTQEQLGEKIGVTNKTVSRWETGTYLPPADALMAMSDMFGVSINELLSGKHLSEAEYRAAAESNLKAAVSAGSFSAGEKLEFYKKKWLKEHRAAMCGWGMCIAAAVAAGAVMKNPLLMSSAMLLLAAGHAWRNNAMMAYAERNTYSQNDREE